MNTLQEIWSSLRHNKLRTMFEMKAAIKIPSSVFVRAGYSANAEILLNRLSNVLTLPENCIEFSGDTSYVYLLKTKEPQAFEKKVVKVGLSDGIKIEIQSGLKSKDKVRGAEIVAKKKEQKTDDKSDDRE